MTTPSELIAEHKRLKAFLKKESDRFDEFCKPHKNRMQQIEGELHQGLLALNNGEVGKASFSTEEGTAYLSTIVTPKITDKLAWLDWVLEAWDERGAMLAIGAPVKAEFDNYVQEKGARPPHTDVSSFTRVNIRSS